ncbi:VOC family protein [Novosphingobium sp. G106]|uniref:VOC family protein n=1 Tax=Novosphingobium sp. G106 TaxID=2849500 RepID=UPI001C2D964C|nr:VOC family protein [Novosphingobium sp. G106]MBV1686224.1 VOC family protein [Novosphingobium sp. G106]
MTKIVNRPKTNGSPRNGLLCGEHVQIAYVTNDLDRACAIFCDRYGVKEFANLDADLPAGGNMRVKLAWSGGTMLELIEASGPGTAFYTDRLPVDQFSIQFHHVAYILDGLTAWNELEDRIAAEERSVPLRGDTPGYMRFCYVYAEELGHYLEYFLLDAEGIAFFESIPGS